MVHAGNLTTQEDRDSMQRIAGFLGTKADKIRALNAAGYSRSAIAAFLSVRYQHVRNVLGPLHASTPSVASAPNEAENPATDFGAVRLDAEGRIALPDSVLSALDAERGETLPWRFSAGDFILMGRESGMNFAHQFAAKHKGTGDESWTDELIAERRREVAREESTQSDE